MRRTKLIKLINEQVVFGHDPHLVGTILKVKKNECLIRQDASPISNDLSVILSVIDIGQHWNVKFKDILDAVKDVVKKQVT
jgi:hypothetical protein